LTSYRSIFVPTGQYILSLFSAKMAETCLRTIKFGNFGEKLNDCVDMYIFLISIFYWSSPNNVFEAFKTLVTMLLVPDFSVDVIFSFV
jgi:hypothetical protein